MTPSEEIALLRQENTELRLKLVQLESVVEELLKKLNKNSSNSSKPPSTDFIRTKSLRVSSGKSVGGQHGHRGFTLEQAISVDEVIIHEVSQCRCCGEDLKNEPLIRTDSHQVFDLPRIQMQVIAHQRQVKYCPHCHTENKGTFPVEASQPTQYGNHLKAFCCYLSNYQLLPYKRVSQLLEDLTNHRISEGTLVKFNHQLSIQLTPFISTLKEHLLSSFLLHFDETGFYFSNQRNWLHVACSPEATFYFAHPQRGKAAMEAMGILNHYPGKAMHDFWASYMDASFACEHFLCNVHHLRDLTFCEEQEKSSWAKEMKLLLLEMKESREDSLSKGLQSLPLFKERELIARYATLLETGKIAHPLPQKQIGKKGKVKKSKSRNLLERFDTYQESILGFLKNFSIPFGNNLAEQAMRMMKLQQKISGCFRSDSGAEVFATIRSYLDTMRKNDFDMMEAIRLAINAQPITPFA